MYNPFLAGSRTTSYWPAFCVLVGYLLLPTFVLAQQESPAASESSDVEARIFSRLSSSIDAPHSLRRAQIVARDLDERIASRRQTKFRWPIANSMGNAIRANEADSLALIALYQSTAGATWRDNSGWLAEPVADWFGVSSDSTGRVVSVALSDNGLFGQLPSGLDQLSALKNLDLSDNTLLGSIPSDLFLLNNLEVLDLSFNSLTGGMPEDVTGLASLTHLILWGNNLSGPLPSSLGDLSGLKELWLFANQFAGEIPASLGMLTQLELLYLDQNLFSGEIPVALVGATNLSELFLDINSLTGSIPAELATLPNLVVLALGSNFLEGEIPEALSSLDKLRVLDLANNRLTGSIPEALSILPNLTSLYLDRNELTGGIPVGIGLMFNLSRLRLADNQLTGPLFSPQNFSLFNLVELDVSDNALDGSLPQFLGAMNALQYLDVSNNNFSGDLPAFQLTFQLREAFFNDNQIGGIISENTFSNLELLQELDLSNNQISGNLPRTIGNLQILRRLILRENDLSGEIPDIIDRLPFLTVIDLWDNEFSGPLPAEFGQLPSLQIADLGSNAFSGEIPESLGELGSLIFLLLDENQFEGAVPASFQNLSNLSGLTLRNNLLEELPDLSSLAALDTIDVSENRFTFEDLESNVGAAGGAIDYSPQALIQTITDRMENQMRYMVNVGGSANQYGWYRSGLPIDGENASTLVLDASSDMDTLYSQITSSIVPDLVLESTPVRTDAVLDRIVVGPDSTFLVRGDSMQYYYEGFDQFDNRRFFSATWEAAGGTISNDGWYVAGESTGEFPITVKNIDDSITGSTNVTIVGSIATEAEIPSAHQVVLHGSYPNPFTDVVQVMVELPAIVSPWHFVVYDILGREITRASIKGASAGEHIIRFETSSWASGVYFYRVEGGGFESTGKVVKAGR